jgi:fucose permease
MIGGCFVVGLGGLWYALIFGAFMIGIGFGGIDFGLNYLFSIGFGRRSAAMVNLLNAFFGVGAVTAPIAIGWLGAEHYAAVFSTFGVVTIICLLSVVFYSNTTGRTTQAPTDGLNYSDIARNRTITWLLVAFFIIYIFHVAVENGIGGWAPTHLETVGYNATFAATITSGFWLAMTLGRFAAAPLSVWMKPNRIMLISCAGLTVSVWLAGYTSFAPFSYLMAGVFIAPIFPTGLAWLGELIPESRKATAWVIALSMLGGVAFPPLIGTIIGVFGVQSASIFMGILAFGCFVAVGYINLAVNRTSSNREIVPENQI